MSLCEIKVYHSASIPLRIKSLVVAQFASNCKAFVRARYGKSAVDSADYIIVAAQELEGLRSGRERTVLCGFALLQDQGPDSLYVDVVCSASRFGSKLLEAGENLAVELGKKLVRLSALPHVVAFYKKKEYEEKDDACSAGGAPKRTGNKVDGYRMTKCVARSRGSKSRGSRSRGGPRSRGSSRSKSRGPRPRRRVRSRGAQ
jgi:hypothetical protein